MNPETVAPDRSLHATRPQVMLALPSEMDVNSAEYAWS